MMYFFFLDSVFLINMVRVYVCVCVCVCEHAVFSIMLGQTFILDGGMEGWEYWHAAPKWPIS